MDDDGTEPEDAAAATDPDAAQDEGAQLREVSEDALQRILVAHKTWLDTDEKKGEKADLSQTDLRKANLRKANLQGANLRGANLQKANLRKTDLRDADLSDAKLSDVTGLLADMLAGANLSNSKLSEDIAAFDGLARVEEISRIARPVFIGILAGCVYSWLTVATTTDARLLTNSASSPLPIIDTEIPIAGFYWVAPILLLGVYLYLHLYLQRLWEGLADLPAVFPDGNPLNKKVYPWLLSGLVRAHFERLQDKRPLLSHLENWAVIFLSWWIVPVTVLMFWGRYLPYHEWYGTGLHVVLLVVSIGSAILLHRHAVRTLRRDVTAFRWRKPWLDPRTYQVAVALVSGVAFALVSLGAIEGEVRRDYAGSIVLRDKATWMPYAFDRVGYRTYANLREADVSTKPAGWTGLSEQPKEGLDESLLEKARAELAQVQGASLVGADLRYADAVDAFLAKADLRGANLLEADLSDANLQAADFSLFANLQRANLSRANLRGAQFLGANLQGANLTHAKLHGADLGGANLQEASLFRANLQNADLSANLQGAILTYAKLQGANLIFAKNLTGEQLDEACGDDKTKLPKYLADYKLKACPTPEQSPAN